MCNHPRKIGDNYGMSCADCGEQLSGYGYGGFFGVKLNLEVVCIHHFYYEPGDTYEICIYCEAIREIEKVEA